RTGCSPFRARFGVRAGVRDPRDADVIRRRRGMLRARTERAHASTQAAAHQAVEDARMQATAVLLALVLPLALHGGALRVEVVEAAKAAAGCAHLPGELHVVGIATRPVDGTATRDAA